MSTRGLVRIERVSGRPIPLRGNDVDTDRIIPARFMTAITFDGLGELAFHDVRFDAEGHAQPHPMNEARYRAKGPQIALVNKNFGCGSSREHAPQALYRWGIHALVGESFADIFFGNCVAMGIPCVTASSSDVARLMQLVEEDPGHELVLDVAARSASYRGETVPVALPDGAAHQLLAGTWDATQLLIEAMPRIREVACRVP